MWISSRPSTKAASSARSSGLRECVGAGDSGAESYTWRVTTSTTLTLLRPPRNLVAASSAATEASPDSGARLGEPDRRHGTELRRAKGAPESSSPRPSSPKPIGPSVSRRLGSGAKLTRRRVRLGSGRRSASGALAARSASAPSRWTSWSGSIGERGWGLAAKHFSFPPVSRRPLGLSAARSLSCSRVGLGDPGRERPNRRFSPHSWRARPDRR